MMSMNSLADIMLLLVRSLAMIAVVIVFAFCIIVLAIVRIFWDVHDQRSAVKYWVVKTIQRL